MHQSNYIQGMVLGGEHYWGGEECKTFSGMCMFVFFFVCLLFTGLRGRKLLKRAINGCANNKDLLPVAGSILIAKI